MRPTGKELFTGRWVELHPRLRVLMPDVQLKVLPDGCAAFALADKPGCYCVVRPGPTGLLDAECLGWFSQP